MLSFRAIEKSDIEVIREYTQKCGIQSCDFTLSGIYLWGVYYKYEMCIYNNTLFIKGVDESGRAAFAFPIGQIEPRKAVELVLEYCRLHSIEPRFSFVPKLVLPAFEGGSALRLEGWSDYIYSAESLKTLSGKKLHKKKNRFNKFIKTYDNYRFFEITCENADKIKSFYAEYLKENQADGERLAAEEMIINRIFENYAALGFDGGALEVDQKIVAFAIGERVGNTLYIHFEKALRSYDGAFEAINCLFVRKFAGDAEFVDREEDMNDLGLRQAKTAYAPLYLVDKYEVVF